MPDCGIITTKLQITCKLKAITLKTYISFRVFTIHHTVNVTPVSLSLSAQRGDKGQVQSGCVTLEES